jgi:hypothetical protein
MAIWYRLRILHFYDGDQAPATPGGEGLLIDPIVLRGGAGTAAGSAGVPGRGAGGGSATTAGAGDAAAVGGLATGGGGAAAGGGGPAQ